MAKVRGVYSLTAFPFGLTFLQLLSLVRRELNLSNGARNLLAKVVIRLYSEIKGTMVAPSKSGSKDIAKATLDF